MAVKVVAKPDRRYLQDRDGQFRPIENLSITASTPVYPAVLHKTRRTMILADDRAHAVVALAYQEPTAATWKALEQHMETERSMAETAREAKSKALLDRKKKVVEIL